MRSDPTLRRWFRLINKKFFLNELPDNVCCRYSDDEDRDEDEQCDRYYGWADLATGRHSYQIVLSKIKNPGNVAKVATLAHEMCHIATALKDDHGKVFSDWHEKLTARGLFRKSAVLDGLTLF